MSSPTPNSPNGIDLSSARLGILGGSGLYAMEGLEDIQELTIETPYGAPSDALRLGR
ncbi:MAG: S-methyl-5-thioadenosine phosphorylase, partial [Cyanobacteriota bacterium]